MKTFPRPLHTFLLWLLFAAIAVWARPSWAINASDPDPAHVYASVAIPGAEYSYEVFGSAATSEAELDLLVKFYAVELAEAKKLNPALAAFVRVIESGSRLRQPQGDSGNSNFEKDLKKIARRVAGAKVSVRFEKLDSATEKSLTERFRDWFNRHYRISFTLIRGAINGTVTTWSLMIARNVPFEIAIPIGLITGSVSGTTQYFNKNLQGWLTKGSITAKLLGARERLATRVGGKIEEVARWTLVEIGFVGIIKTLMVLFGAEPDAGLIQGATDAIATALYSIAAQGFWDIGIASETRQAIEKNPGNRGKIQFRSDTAVLIVSALSVAGAVAKLCQVPIADAALLTLGGAGVLNYARVLLKGKMNRVGIYLTGFKDYCARALRGRF
ncbi:MAG: hypothetical protein HYW49_06555 [Deltaproteobacteria bacterium]|nr:hypothetical protein [Deltaproteobacteria bacterium]